MQKQSENWPGVQYPLKEFKTHNAEHMLHLVVFLSVFCLDFLTEIQVYFLKRSVAVDICLFW